MKKGGLKRPKVARERPVKRRGKKGGGVRKGDRGGFFFFSLGWLGSGGWIGGLVRGSRTVKNMKMQRIRIAKARIRNVQGNPSLCLFRRWSVMSGHTTPPIDAPEIIIPVATPRVLSKRWDTVTVAGVMRNAPLAPKRIPWESRNW